MNFYVLLFRLISEDVQHFVETLNLMSRRTLFGHLTAALS